MRMDLLLPSQQVSAGHRISETEPNMNRPTGPDAGHHAGARLLIVNDEKQVRDLLARWFESEGFECVQIANAEQALELLGGNGFSLLIADILMPGKSGIELLNMTKQQFPDVAVIMVTAVDDRKTAIRALERRRLVLQGRNCERSPEQRVREQTEDIRLTQEEMCLRPIATQQCRHDETGAHIRRIGLYAEVLARHMNYSEQQAEMLRLAAPMHDVGKIGVPDSILMKPGKLTPDEWEVMKTHITIGARILGGTFLPMLNLAQDIALHHHEKWSGSGYSQGICGEAIPEAPRIVAVLDVYDALVHTRVYRPAVAEDAARAIMAKENGTHLDAGIYEAFLELLPELRSIRQQVKDQGGKK